MQGSGLRQQPAHCTQLLKYYPELPEKGVFFQVTDETSAFHRYVSLTVTHTYTMALGTVRQGQFTDISIQKISASFERMYS